MTLPRERRVARLDARRLRELRLAAGLTQRELGQRIAYSQTMISRVERGQTGRDAGVELLVATALALHRAGLEELPWRRGQGVAAASRLGKRIGKGQGRGPRPFARGAAARQA